MQPKQQIERFTVDLQIGKQHLRSGLEDKLAAFAQTELLQMVDEACRELAPPDKTLLLDQIEIDLGRIGVEQLRSGAFDRLRQAFRQKFREKLKGAVQSRPQQYRETSEKDLEVIRTFLQTGRLPWWAKNRRQLLSEALSRTATERPAALQRLLLSLVDQPAILRRLIQNTDLDRRALLLTSYLPIPTAEILEWIETLDRQLKKAYPAFARLPARPAAIRLWEHIFRALKDQSLPGSQATYQPYQLDILGKWVTEYFETTFGSKEIKEDDVKKDPANPPENNREKEVKRPERRTGAKGASPTGRAQPSEKDESRAERGIPGPTRHPVGKDSMNPDPRRRRRSDSESWLIHNAGLVIPAPYFSRFFDRLTLLEKGRFRSEEAVQKAIAVLQYLALGQDDLFEPDLVLNKILCGAEPEAVFWLEEELTEEDREAADLLLNAAIANAPILNGMSAAGFRSTFMRREGVLRFAGGKWMLHVERAAYDIVLDRLPWSFQMIKLPWMAAPLYVEW